MTDKEILEKYINLDNTCLTKREKKEVRDMLYQHKEAFSLKDEIGTCPNIEVGIDVTDKSPFFIRLYHVREEDKKVIDKEMKWLCYLGILKEGFSPYSSPVMLISRKLTQDKRLMTDFRHLNVRIAKNNLAYPLFRDSFSVLGNSKCKVLSVLILKDAFHHWDFQKIPRDIAESYFISEVCHIYIKECLWDWISHLPYGSCT